MLRCCDDRFANLVAIAGAKGQQHIAGPQQAAQLGRRTLQAADSSHVVVVDPLGKQPAVDAERRGVARGVDIANPHHIRIA
jgi:hypothetical protein